MCSVTSTTGGLSVNVIVVAHVFLVVCLGVTWLCEDVPTVHLVVILVVVGDETPYARINAVSVGHGAVVRMMTCAFAIVAAVKHRALERGVGGIGNFAVGTLVHGGGTRSRLEGSGAEYRYPINDLCGPSGISHANNLVGRSNC